MQCDYPSAWTKTRKSTSKREGNRWRWFSHQWQFASQAEQQGLQLQGHADAQHCHKCIGMQGRSADKALAPTGNSSERLQSWKQLTCSITDAEVWRYVRHHVPSFALYLLYITYNFIDLCTTTLLSISIQSEKSSYSFIVQSVPNRRSSLSSSSVLLSIPLQSSESIALELHTIFKTQCMKVL